MITIHLFKKRSLRRSETWKYFHVQYRPNGSDDDNDDSDVMVIHDIEDVDNDDNNDMIFQHCQSYYQIVCDNDDNDDDDDTRQQIESMSYLE